MSSGTLPAMAPAHHLNDVLAGVRNLGTKPHQHYRRGLRPSCLHRPNVVLHTGMDAVGALNAARVPAARILKTPRRLCSPPMYLTASFWRSSIRMRLPGSAGNFGRVPDGRYWSWPPVVDHPAAGLGLALDPIHRSSSLTACPCWVRKAMTPWSASILSDLLLVERRGRPITSPRQRSDAALAKRSATWCSQASACDLLPDGVHHVLQQRCGSVPSHRGGACWVDHAAFLHGLPATCTILCWRRGPGHRRPGTTTSATASTAPLKLGPVMSTIVGGRPCPRWQANSIAGTPASRRGIECLPTPEVIVPAFRQLPTSWLKRTAGKRLTAGCLDRLLNSLIAALPSAAGPHRSPTVAPFRHRCCGRDAVRLG